MSKTKQQEAGGSPIKSGTTKKEPAWTRYFLRALERTGDVRASAEDAGIDHSTAYARRKGHAEFAAAWEEALRLRSERTERERQEELGRLARGPSTIGSSADSPPPRGEPGEELAGSGGQLKRAGHDRWSRRKEKLFFDELAATANVKRAAKAAGVSPNAVYQRRMRDGHFRAKWAAVLETGRAAIEMQLVERAKKSFDPDELDFGETEPRVSVAEALRIVQPGGKGQPAPFEDPRGSEEDIDEVRERLVKKLLRLKQRDMRQRLAEGWSLDEQYDQIVPPGWVRAS